MIVFRSKGLKKLSSFWRPLSKESFWGKINPLQEWQSYQTGLQATIDFSQSGQSKLMTSFVYFFLIGCLISKTSVWLQVCHQTELKLFICIYSVDLIRACEPSHSCIKLWTKKAASHCFWYTNDFLLSKFLVPRTAMVTLFLYASWCKNMLFYIYLFT